MHKRLELGSDDPTLYALFVDLKKAFDSVDQEASFEFGTAENEPFKIW